MIRYVFYSSHASIRSCSCANSPFRLKQAPAFADSVFLITKASRISFKKQRIQLINNECRIFLSKYKLNLPKPNSGFFRSARCTHLSYLKHPGDFLYQVYIIFSCHSFFQLIHIPHHPFNYRCSKYTTLFPLTSSLNLHKPESSL